jgi:ferredoxin-NADP reductase
MNLKLVKKIIEAKNTKSFFFEKPKGLEFVAGQYSYLTLGKTTKQLTIASSPTEEFIQITTRIRRESEFKQNLDNLEIGSEIEARAPFGTFILEDKFKNNIFLAGGIGITPFRSMIKYNIDRKLGIKMHLIYSNSDSEFVFKEELDQWQKENDFIKVSYHNSSISGHLDSFKLSSLYTTYDIQHTVFYAVGPHAFVNSMEDILEELNIPTDKINTEKFTGY